ncbi:MAG: NAD(+)/NADH kinase [Dehalococcoidia bacterium]|nr:NAD(+)/NADH kinase [Dehalococcoidia bacterium]
MKRIGVLYHPKVITAPSEAAVIEQLLRGSGASTWVSSAWDEEKARNLAEGTDLIVSLGGDGTILRAAHIVLPHSIPIVGVNMGRLGFMTELDITEVEQKLPSLARGEGWLDERAMVEAELWPSGEEGNRHRQVFTALNDVVVGRGAQARVVYIEVVIDGQPFTTLKVDAIVLATATGSTGYSLAAGGPILHPQSRDLVMQPVAPHLSLSNGLVLAPDSQVEFRVSSTRPALLSLDGQIDRTLQNDDRVVIRRSASVTRFLRLAPPSAFYSQLESKLRGNRKVESRKG